MKTMRGQASIIGVIMVVFTIFVYLALYPAVSAVITAAIPTLDPTTATLIQFILPFTFLAILVTLYIYVVPTREA